MNKILSIFFSIIALFVFVGCSNGSANNYKYSDYDYYQIGTYEEQVEKSDDEYYIYYYSETCQGCVSIKNDVLGTISKLNSDQLYLFDIARGVPVNSSFNLRYTPTLVRIKNNRYQEKFVGASEILEVLKTLQ